MPSLKTLIAPCCFAFLIVGNVKPADLLFHIEPIQKQFMLGEPILLKVTIENLTGEAKIVDLGFNGYGNFTFSSDGQIYVFAGPQGGLSTGPGFKVKPGKPFSEMILLNDWTRNGPAKNPIFSPPNDWNLGIGDHVIDVFFDASRSMTSKLVISVSPPDPASFTKLFLTALDRIAQSRHDLEGEKLKRWVDCITYPPYLAAIDALKPTLSAGQMQALQDAWDRKIHPVID